MIPPRFDHRGACSLPWLWAATRSAVLVFVAAPDGSIYGASDYARAVANRRGWRTIRECWRGLSATGAKFAWLMPEGGIREVAAHGS